MNTFDRQFLRAPAHAPRKHQRRRDARPDDYRPGAKPMRRGGRRFNRNAAQVTSNATFHDLGALVASFGQAVPKGGTV